MRSGLEPLYLPKNLRLAITGLLSHLNEPADPRASFRMHHTSCIVHGCFNDRILYFLLLWLGAILVYIVGLVITFTLRFFTLFLILLIGLGFVGLLVVLLCQF